LVKEVKKMKEYTSATIDIIALDAQDLIVTSRGVESPDVDLGYGW